jgi:hypothetical protein
MVVGSFSTRGGAEAQAPPDGGLQEGAASEATLSLNCGTTLRRQYVRANETESGIDSATFVPIPFMTMNASVVGSASTACVFVTFSADVNGGSNNFCVLRVLIGGVEMSPTGQGFRNALSLHPTAQATTFVWVHRPTTTANVSISVQARALGGQSCMVDDTLLRIEVFS